MLAEILRLTIEKDGPSLLAVPPEKFAKRDKGEGSLRGETSRA